MKIAIIGASGFIGNRLVEILALDPAATHTPVPIVRQPSSLALPARFDLDCRIADALDPDALAAALQGCDAIAHCALGDPVQIEKMPAALIAAAARAGITRIACLSSASVHGQNIAPGTDETTPLHTRHALDYNNAKVRAERSLFRHAARHPQIRVTALRPGIVFGPRSRWIADTAADLRAGTAWLHDEGRAICNTIYIDNLVHAILLALARSDTNRQPAGSSGTGCQPVITPPRAAAPNNASAPPSPANAAYHVADAGQITWRDFYAPIARALGIDPAAIPGIPELPAFPRTLRDRIEKTTATPLVQKLLPAFPYRLKSSAKKIISALAAPPPRDSWSLPDAPRPRITQELADLQRNPTRLPFDKAARDLGYAPPVPFAEGMRRSLAWLRFARPDYFSNEAL